MVAQFVIQPYVFTGGMAEKMLSLPRVLVLMLRSSCHLLVSASSYKVTLCVFHIWLRNL
jgi:hypothetical protein